MTTALAALYTAAPAAPMWLSGCTNPPTIAAAQVQPRLGMLAQPGNALHLQGPHFSRWAIDNGAFGKARRGTPWSDLDTQLYLRYLRKVTQEVDTGPVLFATAPDVLTFVDGAPRGDAAATWERGVAVMPKIRALGLPVALVAQDGFLATPLDWDAFDVVFLGGSDLFKLGTEGREVAAVAKEHGKWLHMGRVNSYKRLAYAQSIGCDSADGTFIGFGPDINVPKVLSWLERTEPGRPTEHRSAA